MRSRKLMSSTAAAAMLGVVAFAVTGARRSDFHLVGAVLDRVYPDGNPRNALQKVQTWTIPAGAGAVFETVFEKGASDEGIYPFVTHSFADAEKGAVGLIQVGTPKQFATMSH